jgi:UDP:flavonoid glycosyltransferase YjiC (YdhE family)
MLIVLYVSGHGFGHASRDIELIRTLCERRPDARVIVRASLPRWLFAPVAQAAVEVQALETDTVLVQLDSLSFDEQETARQAARFYRDFDHRVAMEAELIRGMRADLVVGDIPPLACAAAARAGVPSVALGNFTWDWIYGVYGAFDRVAPDVIPAIRHAYATTTLALRLPLHGGFEPMSGVIRDIPFIARRSTRDPADTRRRLGLTGDRPIVLSSFGGYGADLPMETLRRSDRFTVIEALREPPAGLLYQDLVAAADVVVSKPGYGIVSECVANSTALLYTSRGRFIEYDLFVAEMPPILRCRFIAQPDLLAGRWADAIDALLAQPAPPDRPAVNGAETAAEQIVNLVIGSSGDRVI